MMAPNHFYSEMNSEIPQLISQTLKYQIYRGSTNTDVVLGGTVKHPEDPSYVELLTSSSVDITCMKFQYRIPEKVCQQILEALDEPNHERCIWKLQGA